MTEEVIRLIDVAGVTEWVGSNCIASPGGQALTPPAPPTLLLTLANGQRVSLTLDAGVLDVLPVGWELILRFDPRPLPPYEVVATALDGASVVQAGDPFHLRVLVVDCATGLPVALPQALLDYPVRLSLPVVTDTTGAALAETQLAWLRALWDADAFSGYQRIDTPHDGPSNALVFSAKLSDVQSALFLPVLIAPSYVENVDPNLHIWSGPNRDVGVGPDADIGGVATNASVDFGLAATEQFTVFKVLAPAVEDRLFVVNTSTGMYGWVDAAGVGPSGPPAASV